MSGPGPGRLLLVEDDPRTRQTLLAVLGEEYVVEAVGDSAGALRALASSTFEVLICDYDLGEQLTTGGTILGRAEHLQPGVSGILLTGHTDYPEVRDLQRQGKFLVLFKPVDPEHLLAWVKNGVVMARLMRTKSMSESRRLKRE